MKNLEKNFCYALNKLALNNKIIFYIFRSLTFTAEWWMYVVYAVIIILIDHSKGQEAFKMGLIAYSIHYPIYYIIKNILKRKRPFEVDENIKALVKPPDKYSLPSGHSSV